MVSKIKHLLLHWYILNPKASVPGRVSPQVPHLFRPCSDSDDHGIMGINEISSPLELYSLYVFRWFKRFHLFPFYFLSQFPHQCNFVREKNISDFILFGSELYITSSFLLDSLVGLNESGRSQQILFCCPCICFILLYHPFDIVYTM